MRLHRFYLEQKVGDKKELTIPDSELAHQLLNVFRFKSGDKIIVFDGSGFEYEAEIISLNKKEVKFKVGPLAKPQGKDALGKEALNKKNNVCLYLSLIKKGNFELAVEKCTEVGVVEIQPVISARSEKKDLNPERLGRIVKEASEQSGRVTLPEVRAVIGLEDAVSQVVREGKRGVVFHISGLPTLDKAGWRVGEPGRCDCVLPTTSASEGHSSLEKEEISGRLVATFVGPEGGWTEEEMDLFKRNNFEILSLGPNILRAETAAIVAVWEVLRWQ